MEEKERIVKVEESTKQAHKRLDMMEHKFENMYDLTLSVKEIALEIRAMREDVNKIETRVNAIEEKPGKRYDSIITTIISCIVTAVVTFFLVKLGVK